MKISKNQLKNIIKEVHDTSTDEGTKKHLITEAEPTGFGDMVQSFKKGFSKGKQKQGTRIASKDRLKSLQMVNKELDKVYDALEQMEAGQGETLSVQKKFNNTIAARLKALEKVVEEIGAGLESKDEIDVADIADKIGSYEIEPEELEEMIREEISKIFKEE